MNSGRLLVLAILGDPTLPPGISRAGGMNQTIKQHLLLVSRLQLQCTVITGVSEYADAEYERISPTVELFRIRLTSDEIIDQELLLHATDRILCEIQRILSNNRFEIIHSFYWFSGYLASVLKEKYKIPLIHTVVSTAYEKIASGIKPNSKRQLACEHATFTAADYILAITEQEFGKLTDYYKIPYNKIIVVGRSVPDLFHTPPRDESGLPSRVKKTLALRNTPTNDDAPWWNNGAFIYIGRILETKGVDYVIRAWVALAEKHPNCTPPLWLVGGDPDSIYIMRKKLINIVPKLSHYERMQQIIWWGYLDENGISSLMLKGLALVTHSKFEAGGRVIIEAMCLGKPVITTPEGFGADYVFDWYNGFTVQYGDVKKLTKYLECFALHRLLSNVMGNCAKAYFTQIERTWNYTGIHEMLYFGYLQGKKLQLSSKTKPLPKQCDYHQKIEMLTTFPYSVVQYDKKQWVMVLSETMKNPTVSFLSEKIASCRANIVSVNSDDGRFIAKQFYSRFNRDCLWNPLDCNSGLHGRYLLRKAVESSRFNGISPIEQVSEVGAFFYTYDLELVAVEILDEFLNIITLLGENEVPAINSTWHLEMLNEFTVANLYRLHSQFTKHCPEDKFNPVTLELALGLLTLCSHPDEDIHSVSCLNEGTVKLLETTKQSTHFGLVYGKSLCGHTVRKGNSISLLPSDSWYYGEMGPDLVMTSLELNPERGMLDSPMRTNRLLLWQLYFVWLESMRCRFGGNRGNKMKNELLSDTIAEVKNLLRP